MASFKESSSFLSSGVTRDWPKSWLLGGSVSHERGEEES